MTPQEKLVDEALDLYLKTMTAEQQHHFEEWVKSEVESGRLADPDAKTLNTITWAWMGGWSTGRMEIVRGVHDL